MTDPARTCQLQVPPPRVAARPAPDDPRRFDVSRGMENKLPTGFCDRKDDFVRFQAAQGDMRIEVVKRAINQGALAGFQSTISDFAAWLVIDALDSYDDHASGLAFERGFQEGSSLDARQAYADGFRQGVALGRQRGQP